MEQEVESYSWPGQDLNLGRFLP